MCNPDRLERTYVIRSVRAFLLILYVLVACACLVLVRKDSCRSVCVLPESRGVLIGLSTRCMSSCVLGVVHELRLCSHWGRRFGCFRARFLVCKFCCPVGHHDGIAFLLVLESACQSSCVCVIAYEGVTLFMLHAPRKGTCVIARVRARAHMGSHMPAALAFLAKAQSAVRR